MSETLPDATAPAKVLMVDPTGGLVDASAADVAQLLRVGYRQASADESAKAAQDAANAERFGGVAGALEAGAAGAARGLTFGLSDLALTKTGIVAPETLQALKEQQPIASAVGEIGSALATLPKAAAGAGLKAAAKGLAPGLIGAAGREVEQQLGGKLLGKAAAGALEGGLWGAGNVVSEAALGDPNFTAESAWHEIGLSAALGGGLGGLVHVAGAAAPKAISAAKSAVTWADGQIDKFMMGKYPELAEKLAGVQPGTVREIWQNRAQLWTDPTKRAEVAKRMTDNLQAVKESGDDIKTIIAKELKPDEFEHAINSQVKFQNIEAQVQDLSGTMDRAANEIRAHPGDYYSGAARELDILREQLLAESVELLEKPWGKFHKVFQRIEKTKQDLWDLAKPLPESASMADKRTAKLARDVWGAFKTGLEDAETWGSAGARQASLNHAIHEYSVATKNLESTIAGRTLQRGAFKEKVFKPESVNRWLNQMLDQRGEWQGEVIDDWVAAYKALVKEADASYQARPLSQSWNRQAFDDLVVATERDLAQANVSARTTAALQSIAPESLASSWGSNPVRLGLSGGGHGGTVGALGISAAVGPGAMAAVGAGATIKAALDFAGNPSAVIRTMMRMHETNKSVQRGLDAAARALARRGEAGSHALRDSAVAQLAHYDVEAQVARYEKRAALVGEHWRDPIGALAGAAGDLGDHTPNTAAAAQQAGARKLSYLAALLPSTPQRGPLGDTRQVSLSEIQAFNRAYHAVSRPIDVLRRAAAGTASADEIRAVQATSPALFERFRGALVRELAARDPEKLTGQQKRIVSRILGQDVDGSIELGRALQAARAASSAQMAQPQPRKPEIHQSDRMLTPAQAGAQRGGTNGIH